MKKFVVSTVYLIYSTLASAAPSPFDLPARTASDCRVSVNAGSGSSFLYRNFPRELVTLLTDKGYQVVRRESDSALSVSVMTWISGGTYAEHARASLTHRSSGFTFNSPNAQAFDGVVDPNRILRDRELSEAKSVTEYEVIRAKWSSVTFQDLSPKSAAAVAVESIPACDQFYGTTTITP